MLQCCGVQMEDMTIVERQGQLLINSFSSSIYLVPTMHQMHLDARAIATEKGTDNVVNGPMEFRLDLEPRPKWLDFRCCT